MAGSIPDLAQWVKALALLWLWCRLVAVALIRPLAWEPPYAMGVALEKTKKKQRKETVGADMHSSFLGNSWSLRLVSGDLGVGLVVVRATA